MNRTMDAVIEDIGYQIAMLEESVDVLKTTAEVIGGFHSCDAALSAARANSSIQVVIRDISSIRERMIDLFEEAETLDQERGLLQ